MNALLKAPNNSRSDSGARPGPRTGPIASEGRHELRLESLTKDFDTGAKAVDGISLSFPAGELTALLGPSGCGKTTTLRMIAGLIHPTSGMLLLDDQPLNEIPANKRKTLMVFQSYALFPHMTVRKNVAFGLEMFGWKRDAIAARVTEVLELVGLDHLAERRPAQLSGGQQQRVALARAVAPQPPVLLLDEPLSNLDAQMRWEMRREIRRVQQELNITTVLVTHDQDEALMMADNIAIMRDGKVAQVGKPMDVYEFPQTKFVASFIGRANTFDGSVIDVAGGTITVDSLGRRMTVAARDQMHTPVAGETVAVVVRPDRVIVRSEPTPGGTGMNEVRCRIDHVAYLGGHVHLAVTELGNGEPLEASVVHVDVTPVALAAGDEVWLTWADRDARIVKV